MHDIAFGHSHTIKWHQNSAINQMHAPGKCVARMGLTACGLKLESELDFALRDDN